MHAIRGKTNKLLVSSISEAIDIYIPVMQLVPALKDRRQERHWRFDILRSVHVIIAIYRDVNISVVGLAVSYEPMGV